MTHEIFESLHRLRAQVDLFEQARAEAAERLRGQTWHARSAGGLAEAVVAPDATVTSVTIDQRALYRGRADVIAAEVVEAIDLARGRQVEASLQLVARLLRGSRP